MFLLGLGEAANFPACIKTVAEWFPKRERALATGIFNSGANIGNIAGARCSCRFAGECLVEPGAELSSSPAHWASSGRFLAHHLSPPGAAPRVSKAELDLILSDPGEKIEKVPWSRVVPLQRNLGLRHRQVSHRSHLVVLSLLDSRLPADHFSALACRKPAAAWSSSIASRSSAASAAAGFRQH